MADNEVPKTPDDYKAEFPADFKAPEGVKINVDDPRFKEAQRSAHARGMSQELFSGVLALEVRRVIDANARARAAEPGKIPGYDKMSTRQKFALADKRGR
jgi:hypothetical protein